MRMNASSARGWQVRVLYKPEASIKKRYCSDLLKISKQSREIPLISEGYFKTFIPILQHLRTLYGYSFSAILYFFIL